MNNHIKLIPDKKLFDAGIIRYIYWFYTNMPHIAIFGNTGSGKSYLLKIILGRIAIEIPDSEIIVCDLKADTDFNFLNGHKNFYRYNECSKGLEYALHVLHERQQGTNTDRHFVAFVFDEWASFINSLDKKSAEQAKQSLSTLLMLGRSFHLHIILSQQRLDATYFNSARDNFNLIIGLGTLSKEAISMVYSEYKDIIDSNKPQGEGSMIIGNQFKEIIVPRIYDINKLHNCIKTATDRYSK